MSYTEGQDGVELLRPYSRNGSFPIDASACFGSYADALAYIAGTASDPTTAYPTQILGVFNEENHTSALYRVQYALTGIAYVIPETYETTSAYSFDTVAEITAALATVNGDYPLHSVLYDATDGVAMIVMAVSQANVITAETTHLFQSMVDMQTYITSDPEAVAGGIICLHIAGEFRLYTITKKSVVPACGDLTYRLVKIA